jgi:hypothetical protein
LTAHDLQDAWICAQQASSHLTKSQGTRSCAHRRARGNGGARAVDQGRRSTPVAVIAPTGMSALDATNRSRASMTRAACATGNAGDRQARPERRGPHWAALILMLRQRRHHQHRRREVTIASAARTLSPPLLGRASDPERRGVSDTTQDETEESPKWSDHEALPSEPHPDRRPEANGAVAEAPHAPLRRPDGAFDDRRTASLPRGSGFGDRRQGMPRVPVVEHLVAGANEMGRVSQRTTLAAQSSTDPSLQRCSATQRPRGSNR